MCQTALTRRRNSIPTASGDVCPVLTMRALGHRTLKPASGGHRPVRCQFENLSAHESDGNRTRPVPLYVRPVTPQTAHITRPPGQIGQFPLSPRIFRPPHPSPNSLNPPPPSDWQAPASSELFPAPDPSRASPSPSSSRVDPISRGFKDLGESFDPCPRGVRFNA